MLNRDVDTLGPARRVVAVRLPFAVRDLGFHGRIIVASEIEVPNMLVNLG